MTQEKDTLLDKIVNFVMELFDGSSIEVDLKNKDKSINLKSDKQGVDLDCKSENANIKFKKQKDYKEILPDDTEQIE